MGGADHSVYALDIITGRVQWAKRGIVESLVSAFALGPGVVYVSMGECPDVPEARMHACMLRSLNASASGSNHRLTAHGRAPSAVHHSAGLHSPPCAVHAEQCFAAPRPACAESADLYALNATDGAVLWRLGFPTLQPRPMNILLYHKGIVVRACRCILQLPPSLPLEVAVAIA